MGYHLADVFVGGGGIVEPTAHRLHAVVAQLAAQLAFANLDFGLGACDKRRPVPCKAELMESCSPRPPTMKPGAVIVPGMTPSTPKPASVAPLRCTMAARPSGRVSPQAKL